MSIRLARWIATWFGCGYAPAGPGTAGSLAAVLIAWALARWAGWPPWAIFTLGVIITAPAIWAADVTVRATGKKDPGIVVVDEVVGQWITFAGAVALDWTTLITAFVLFRLFDIWKPPPVRQLERLHGGLGVVMDDLFAGVYAAVLLFVISRLIIRQ